MGNKDFKLEVKWVAIDKVIPYVNNTKKHPPEQIADLVAQINAFGFDQPIVVDKEMVIIKGHGRRQACEKLGLTKVPVVIAEHLTEEQTKAARIADNKVAESEWDMDLLKFELGSLQRVGDVDMKLTGFHDNHLKKLLDEGDVSVSNTGGSGEGETGGDGEDLAHEPVNDFFIAVNCRDEKTQNEMFQKLTDEGFECKIID